MNALKASWEVRAGVIPGTPIPAFTKRWHYTSEQRAADEAGGAADPAYHSKFAELRAVALDYYMQVSMPSLNNWAELVFIWY